MLVTGVQSAGSKGVSNVQIAAVDTKEAARTGSAADNDGDRNQVAPRAGDPQPVIFPRSGETPLDQRPVALRQQAAAERYKRDGGEDEHPDDRDERARR